jgi:hypothetical protein
MAKDDSALGEISALYKWFSVNEAKGQSDLWSEFAEKVSEDPDLLAFLADLPKPKRQPNLFFATARSLYGTPTEWTKFRSHILSDRATLANRMAERSTQTNEPGRCAVLLPLMASLPQPLAIIEVGAAAGLCLLLDRYGYDYGERGLIPPSCTESPVFPCEAIGKVPIPKNVPEIGWRYGLDLNPLDVTDNEQMTWLETLVWPGQDQRLCRLRQSIAVAVNDPPPIYRGDLLIDLAAVLAKVPSGLPIVIFHSAVMNYLPSQDARDAFADLAMQTCDYWIANESPLVLPKISSKAGRGRSGSFLMSMNSEPVAWTNAHGASIEWIV